MDIISKVFNFKKISDNAMLISRSDKIYIYILYSKVRKILYICSQRQTENFSNYDYLKNKDAVQKIKPFNEYKQLNINSRNGSNSSK